MRFLPQRGATVVRATRRPPALAPTEAVRRCGAGLRLALSQGMRSRLAPLVVVLALVTGCKAMGGLASGLGHVAGGIGHVAGGLSRVAGGVGRVAGGVGRVVVGVGRVTGTVVGAMARATPVVVDVAEAIALAPGEPPLEDLDEPDEPVDDPCTRCPMDLACSECVGDGGMACRLAPVGVPSRCIGD